MNPKKYVVNPILEIVEVELGSLSIVSPVDRYSLRDETLLVTELIKAAAHELDVAAFAEENAAQYPAAAVETTVEALAARQVLVPLPSRKPLDPYFEMLEYGRVRSGPPLAERPTFEDPSQWNIAVAGTGLLASRVRAELADFGFAVGTFSASDVRAGVKPRLIVACADTDDLAAFRAVNRVAVAAGIPAYYLSIDRHLVRAGPLVLPRKNACIECLFHRVA